MSRRAAVLVILWTAVLTVASTGWQRRQADLPPAWDQALYLTMSLQYHRALTEEGPGALVRRVIDERSAVAPLFPLSTVPVYGVLGESREAAELTPAPYLFLLVLGTALLARQAGASPLYAALAVFLLSTYTGIVNFSREYMMDLPAAALATLALAVLWGSESLTRKGASALAGLLTGLALLTKVLSGIFFAGPVLYSLRKSFARGAAVFAAGILVTAAVWYGSHYREIARYVADYGFGEGSLPFRSGGDRILSLSNFAYYFLTAVQQGTGLLPSAALALSLLAFLLFRGEARLPAFLAVWLASGYLLLTLLPNKGGERYLLALLPPVAVIAARSMAAISRTAVRRSVVGAAALSGALNYAGLTWQNTLTTWTHHHFGTFPHSQPLRPEEMKGWPVDAVLESLMEIREQKTVPPSAPEVTRFLMENSSSADEEFLRAAYREFLGREPDPRGIAGYRSAPDRRAVVESLIASEEFRSRPLRVLVVPDHRVFNAATLTYLAERDRLPLSFHHSASDEASPDAELRWETSGVGSFRCPDGSRIRAGSVGSESSGQTMLPRAPPD